MDTTKKRKKGFTLIELLVVIAIIGLMVGMLMPLARHQDTQAKVEETRRVFDEIRYAILGARNSFDASGDKVLGGYAGHVSWLPKLYVYEWSATGWVHPDTSPSDGKPDTTHNAASGAIGDANAQPAALWRNDLTGFSDPLVDEDKWHGPYMAEPDDKYPEDQARTFTSGTDQDNDRRFCLRETEGRLADAWGRSFIIYVDDADGDGSPDMHADNETPLNLVFVSAGPDSRYAASDPANLGIPANEDNLVFRITQGEWDLTAQKTTSTKNLLEGLKTAITGPQNLKGGDAAQPTGFVADVGCVDPLIGSVVKDATDAYLCIQTHLSSSTNAPPDADYWSNAGEADEFPHAPQHDDTGVTYYEPKPELLQVNEDHVSYDGKNYRCLANHTSGASNRPDLGTGDWTIDNSVTGPLWQSGEHYKSDILPSWKYYPTCQMWAGRQAAYISPQAEIPFKDGWGEEIVFEINNATKDITIYSLGPDPTDASDDIPVFISRTEYEVPVEVCVHNATAKASFANVDVRDISEANPGILDAYVPFNGRIRVRRVWAEIKNTGPDGSTKFGFTNGTGTYSDPHVPAYYSGLHAPIRSETNGTSVSMDMEPDPEPIYGPFLPIGRRYFVYRDYEYTSDGGLTRFGSPSSCPDTLYYSVNATSNKPGPPGYQKAVIVYPKSQNTVTFGEDE